MTEIRLTVVNNVDGTLDFAINQVDLLECNITPVPIPPSVFLLGTGLLGLLALRGRRKA